MQEGERAGLSRREFVGRALLGAVAAGGLPVGSLQAGGRAEEAGKEDRPRRSHTDRVKLGKSGVAVTRLGIGTGSQGGRVQRDLGPEGFGRLVRHAHERGIRFIDTADNYNTHEMVREAIRGLPREDLVIQTKMKWEPFVPDAEKELDRFRKELGLDRIDIVLIHCAQKKGWPEDLKRMRDGLSRAKEKGIIRAHGVSCHGLPALREVPGCDWVDVNLARVNHRGHHMDGARGDWAEASLRDESVEVLKKVHAAGKGLIGMKIIGNGDFSDPEERERSISYAMQASFVDAVVIGFKSAQEIDEVLARMGRALEA